MSMLVNAKSNTSPKDAPGRARRHGPESYRTLPGEASGVRALEESAEAIVAEKGVKATGAKGRKTNETD